MSAGVKPFSAKHLAVSVALTALIVGLCYWLWQDVKPVLRPLKGEGWAFVKDLRFFASMLAVFALVTTAGFLMDRSGAASMKTRIIAGCIIGVVVIGLFVYGTFLEKQLWPALTSLF